ncbi:hypothetical protein C1H46_037340 [Malus baccata]|uniref:Uncharacterized protein n=1 Tax=Malus baccata TaxID=106549 RepID=A0A540KSC9_MALBA|nr:hypothetical protein C1H46_037340 [Malus baccata]
MKMSGKWERGENPFPWGKYPPNFFCQRFLTVMPFYSTCPSSVHGLALVVLDLSFSFSLSSRACMEFLPSVSDLFSLPVPLHLFGCSNYSASCFVVRKLVIKVVFLKINKGLEASTNLFWPDLIQRFQIRKLA